MALGLLAVWLVMITIATSLSLFFRRRRWL
jgi:hypothetical protein